MELVHDEPAWLWEAAHNMHVCACFFSVTLKVTFWYVTLPQFQLLHSFGCVISSMCDTALCFSDLSSSVQS